jgi:hypothetical protein
MPPMVFSWTSRTIASIGVVLVSGSIFAWWFSGRFPSNLPLSSCPRISPPPGCCEVTFTMLEGSRIHPLDRNWSLARISNYYELTPIAVGGSASGPFVARAFGERASPLPAWYIVTDDYLVLDVANQLRFIFSRHCSGCFCLGAAVNPVDPTSLGAAIIRAARCPAT